MKILLDNCVKKHVVKLIPGHEVVHSVDIGWAALKNGELLAKAALEFDVLVTVDKRMRFQSNLKGIDLCVAILDIRSNDLAELRLAVEQLLARVESLKPGLFTVIEVR